ncbi:hypothetical protein MHYP_G00189640 [Metynnis hypsauchen]
MCVLGVGVWVSAVCSHTRCQGSRSKGDIHQMAAPAWHTQQASAGVRRHEKALRCCGDGEEQQMEGADDDPATSPICRPGQPMKFQGMLKF